jgi:methionyl-tRNA formyltransferase
MSVTAIFFGNSLDPFSNRLFQALVDTPADLLAVVDAPPAARMVPFEIPGRGWNFVQRANRRRVPVFEPAGLDDPEFVETLSDLGPGLIIAAGYPLVFPDSLLVIPRLAAVGCHPSLLPAFRGCNPILQTLRSGERLGGLTLYQMTSEPCTGPIFAQERVRTRGSDTVADLAERIMDTANGLMDQLIASAERGRLHGRAQKEADASTFPALTEDDYRLDWAWTARKISRWVTAAPGECFFEVNGERLYAMDAERVRLQQTLPVGELAYVGRNSGTVAAGEDGVRIREVRPADSGTVMLFNEWIRACGLEAGNSLI